MTNILALPKLSMPCAIESNEDWIDAIVAYYDANGVPVALDGISFELQVRAATGDNSDIFLAASTDEGRLMLLPASALIAVASPGTGQAVGDVLQLAGGTFITAATLAVIAVGLASATMSAAGASYAANDTIPLAGGTSTSPVVIHVDTVDGSGHILTWHIQSAGAYTIAPTSFTPASTSGLGSGATFNAPVWGVATAKMTSAGIYTALPSSPVAQGASSGLGAGAAFTLTWVNNALVIIAPVATLSPAFVAGSYLYEIRAKADSDTVDVASGPLTMAQGIVL